MYRRCCRLLTMVAVNAAPAAAVLLTDGANNSTAAHHFLITQPPPTPAAGMDRADNNTSFVIIDQEPENAAININNGLLLYYHQCSFYSQKVGRDCDFVLLCVCVLFLQQKKWRSCWCVFFFCNVILARECRLYFYHMTMYVINFCITENKLASLTFNVVCFFLYYFFSDSVNKTKFLTLCNTSSSLSYRLFT